MTITPTPGPALAALTRRRIEALRPALAELAEGLLRELISFGPPADLVAAYARRMPVAVSCAVLGVPGQDRLRFEAWTARSLATGGEAENQETIRLYLGGLVAEHRAEPRPDLLSALLAAGDEEHRLSERELVEVCFGLLLSAYESSTALLPAFVWTLHQHPAELARLHADPALIPNAVTELTRLCEQSATGPLDLDRPRRSRPGPRPLGAHLVRVQLEESLAALLRLLPGLRVAGPVTWGPTATGETLLRLPVAW